MYKNKRKKHLIFGCAYGYNNYETISQIHTWFQSPTQWSPLTSRIDLCQRLTVVQDSLPAIFLLYISLVATSNIIFLFKVKILLAIGNI